MISSEKEPIAKARSYVLKTSMLERALVEAGIEVEVHLVYRTPQIDGSTLEAFYWMPNPNVPHRRVYVRAGSLPSADRADAQQQLREIALPSFVQWLSALHREPENAPVLYAEPYFDAKYLDGNLHVVRKPAA